MLENVTCLGHSTIKINSPQTIYIDPYNLSDNYQDADFIFITHSHYDHFSPEDILKIKKDNTKIIIPADLLTKTIELGFQDTHILVVKPNESYTIDNIPFKTIPSYNTNKQFHKKEYDWVGFIIDINNLKYYIAGDTDITTENRLVNCDVAFVPVGGTYTMNYQEAAELINQIKPKIVIPIHYGIIVGTKQDAQDFQNLLDSDIKCQIMY